MHQRTFLLNVDTAEILTILVCEVLKGIICVKNVQ